MTGPSDLLPTERTTHPPEAVQRWRVGFRRTAPALELSHGEIVRAIEAAVVAGGLPTATTPAGRPRVAFGAQLPAGLRAEGERFEVLLTARRTMADVRAALETVVPAGLAIVDLHDVWLGAPSLSASIAAADHRVRVTGATPEELSHVGAGLLDAPTLPRERLKGGGRSVAYDLRPLLLGFEVIDAAGPASGAGDPAAATAATPALAPASDPGADLASSSVVLRIRLRISPDGPSGRPDEVVLALGERLGRALAIVDHVRERLLTFDELGPVR